MILKLNEDSSNKYVNQLSSDARSTINNLRNACAKLGNLIKTHSEILNYTDVKLYSIAYNGDDEDLQNYFDLFCDDQWTMFSEWLDEHNLTTIGVRNSNSKFYIRNVSENIINNILNDWSNKREYKDSLDTDDAVSIGKNFVYDWYAENYIYDGTTLDFIDHIETDDTLNEFIDSMFDLMGRYDYDIEDVEETVAITSDLDTEIINSIIPPIKNIIDGYDYLNYLKEHEMDIWNDYVAFEKEQETEY